MSDPTDEELYTQMQEEMKRIKVSDLLTQTLYTVSSLGFQKLSAESRDLPQARLAIEALRALLGVLGDEAPEELRRDFQQVVANLQLAYADAAAEPAGAGTARPSDPIE